MKPIEFHGYFDDKGKLQASQFVAALNALRVRRVPVVLTVQEFVPKRSSQANRYYHKVVVGMIADGLKDLGWEPWECSHDAVHEMLKRKFLSVDKPIGEDGEYVEVTRSTTRLNKEEFGEYIEHCVRFAAEYLNTVIPPPGEQQELIAA